MPFYLKGKKLLHQTAQNWSFKTSHYVISTHLFHPVTQCKSRCAPISPTGSSSQSVGATLHRWIIMNYHELSKLQAPLGLPSQLLQRKHTFCWVSSILLENHPTLIAQELRKESNQKKNAWIEVWCLSISIYFNKYDLCTSRSISRLLLQPLTRAWVLGIICIYQVATQNNAQQAISISHLVQKNQFKWMVI